MTCRGYVTRTKHFALRKGICGKLLFLLMGKSPILYFELYCLNSHALTTFGSSEVDIFTLSDLYPLKDLHFV